VCKKTKPQYGTAEDEGNSSILSLCPPDQGQQKQWHEHGPNKTMIDHVRQKLIVRLYIEPLMH